MLLFISALLCVFFYYVSIYIFSRNKEIKILSFIFGLIALLLVSVSGINSIKASKFVIKQQEIHKMLAYYDSIKYISNEERIKMFEYVIDQNTEIKTNKKFCKNMWINLFYSKKIGNLDTLNINKLPSNERPDYVKQNSLSR